MKLDRLHIAISPLDDRVYLGTVRKPGEFQDKRDFTSDFLRTVLEWCPPDYQRDITGSGGSRYRVTVEKLADAPQPEEQIDG